MRASNETKAFGGILFALSRKAFRFVTLFRKNRTQFLLAKLTDKGGPPCE